MQPGQSYVNLTGYDGRGQNAVTINSHILRRLRDRPFTENPSRLTH